MSPKAPRAQAMKGYTICRKTSGCGKIFTTITLDASTGQPAEVFIRFGKAGGCGSAIADGIARLASYGLRSGLDPLDAIKALEGIGCHQGSNSCMTVVAESLQFVMKAIATGRDINEIIEEAEFATANDIH
jgi:hypothetical protein